MTAVIVLGILTWVLMAIPLTLFLARMNRLRALAVELPVVPPAGKPVLTPTAEAKPILAPSTEAKPVFAPIAGMRAGFPAEPTRFVGRAEAMAAAGAVLAPASRCTAVVFQGMAGAGKTTCAVELAHRHQRAFVTMAFWSAPTDPAQCGDALRLLVMALAAQLGDDGFAMVEEIATVARLENFLPTLTAVFADAGLLLVLDNLDTLLTPDGQWRDGRWAPLINALTGHQGPSRVILTSRVVPAGLTPDAVLVCPVHTLSRKESLWLVRRLPHLRAVLHTGALGRSVLTLAQGHPLLLELAAAAATDPPRLAFQLAEIEAAVEGAPRKAFLTQGHTKLDAGQLSQSFTTWTVTVAATLPTPARLLLQALCRTEETDRNATVVGVNWAALWRRWGRPGEPPPLALGVAALASAALISTDPLAAPADPVRYQIHPGVVEAIQAATPQPVTAAVDAQLAAWWGAVAGGWAIEHPQAGESVVQASLAAARYLLRQHDWDAASCLLERALIQQGYSPLTSLAVLPLLRRIAEATGALKDLVVLAAALRKVDPGEAEALLCCAYDQASASGEHGLASTTAGDLATLLRDQGRLREALTLADQKIEHTRQAGFGFWTQLSDQGRRLQILNLLGHHEQVLIDVRTVRARIAELPDERTRNDRVNPWNARENILDIGRLSAVTLERWDDALDLNDEITTTQRRRGASPCELARTRFNDYLPLLRLDRLTDVAHCLRDCQDAFDAAGDVKQLAAVYGARATLEDRQDHPVDAVGLQRTSLRLCYAHPDPREISTAHHNLANYLSRAAGNPAEQRAHRLAATLLHHLTGNTRELTSTLQALTSELRNTPSGPDAPPLPTTLPEITHLTDADDGARLSDLISTLCPDPTTAEHALTALVTTATTPAQQSR
jgi:hypothetical protein